MSNDENTPIELMEVDSALPLVPSASSDAADTTASNVYADDIFLGAKFRDYNHFSRVFSAYRKKTDTLYSKGSSKKLEDPNNPDFVKKYVYDSVVFVCKFGKHRDRGTGKRKKQTSKIDCRSRLRLNLNRKTKYLQITVLIDLHNHECVSPPYDAKNKLIPPKVIPYAPEVLAEIEAKNNRFTLNSSSVRTPLAEVNRSSPTVSAQNATSPMASGQHLFSEGESGKAAPEVEPSLHDAGNNTLSFFKPDPSADLNKMNQEFFKWNDDYYDFYCLYQL